MHSVFLYGFVGPHLHSYALLYLCVTSRAVRGLFIIKHTDTFFSGYVLTLANQFLALYLMAPFLQK